MTQEEGWVTHLVAISPGCDTVVRGAMHAENGQSWLIAKDTGGDEERCRTRFTFGPMRSGSFSKDGSRFAGTTGNGRVRIYRTRDLRLLHEHAGHEGWILSVALSPDGSLVATGGRDKTLRLCRVESGEELWRTSVDGMASALVFLPGRGGFVATHHHGPLILWKVDGKRVTIADTVPSTVALSVSRGGRLLASAHRDGKVRCWSLAERKLIWERICGRRAYAVAFAPDGGHLAAAGATGDLKIWRCSDGVLAAALKSEQTLAALRWGAGRLLGADPRGRVRVWIRQIDEQGDPVWRQVRPEKERKDDQGARAVSPPPALVRGALSDPSAVPPGGPDS